MEKLWIPVYYGVCPPPCWHFSQPNHFTPQTPPNSSVPSFTLPTPSGGGPLAFLLLCPGGMQHYPWSCHNYTNTLPCGRRGVACGTEGIRGPHSHTCCLYSLWLSYFVHRRSPVTTLPKSTVCERVYGSLWQHRCSSLPLYSYSIAYLFLF